MKEYFKIANDKIIDLIKELSVDADSIISNLNDSDEIGKVALLNLYYKTVLRGCIVYGKETGSLVKMIEDCAMDKSDVTMILDRYCDKPVEKAEEGDIELDENPPIDIDVEEVYDMNDIVLDENPPIDIDVEEIYNEGDIVLDENPPIDIDVKEVYDMNDIVLDENPPIDIDVKKVEIDGIELDENPPIDIDVEEIYNIDDIVLDENPDIDVDVKGIKKFEYTSESKIELKENPPIDIDVKEVKSYSYDSKENSSENKKSPLFGNLDFEVKEVSKIEPFNYETFRKKVEAERMAKRNKKKKKK